VIQAVGPAVNPTIQQNVIYQPLYYRFQQALVENVEITLCSIIQLVISVIAIQVIKLKKFLEENFFIFFSKGFYLDIEINFCKNCDVSCV
jgi:hypothetical protein